MQHHLRRPLRQDRSPRALSGRPRGQGRETVAKRNLRRSLLSRYSRHTQLAGAIAIPTPAANTTTSTRYQREHQPLERVLGLSQSTAIVVGTIIGSGIFLVPQEMMRAVGHSSLVYLAWIAGGLLSLFGAMTYAELAARMPHAGGEYVYIRRAYGDLPAFLYMWTWFAVAKPASIATVTIGLARMLAHFPVFSGSTTPPSRRRFRLPGRSSSPSR